MTKGDILNSLKASGDIIRFTATPVWRKAFDLYNADKKERLSPNCSMCFKKVSAWLQG
jgi:hypothetical protein